LMQKERKKSRVKYSAQADATPHLALATAQHYLNKIWIND